MPKVLYALMNVHKKGDRGGGFGMNKKKRNRRRLVGEEEKLKRTADARSKAPAWA